MPRNVLTLKQKTTIIKIAETAKASGKPMNRVELQAAAEKAIDRDVSIHQIGRIDREMDLGLKPTPRGGGKNFQKGGNSLKGHHHRQAVIAQILTKVVNHTGMALSAEDIEALADLRARRRVAGEDEARGD